MVLSPQHIYIKQAPVFFNNFDIANLKTRLPFLTIYRWENIGNVLQYKNFVIKQSLTGLSHCGHVTPCEVIYLGQQNQR